MTAVFFRIQTAGAAAGCDLLILFYALKDISAAIAKIAACGRSYRDVVQIGMKSCTLYNSQPATNTSATITTPIKPHPPLKDWV